MSKYYFAVLLLLLKVGSISAQTLQIVPSHTTEGFNYEIKGKNPVIITTKGESQVSVSLLNQLLDQCLSVEIRHIGDISLSGKINTFGSGSLKIVSENKGTIRILSGSGITNETSKLDIVLRTDGEIEIAQGAILKSGGGDLRLQAKNETGRIKRMAESQIQIKGWLSASGKQEGGRIIIESDDIILHETARLLSQGAQKGGTILIGGDWQGGGDIAMRENESIYEAISVDMKKGAVVDASATHIGNGGKVVVWSNINHPRSHTGVQGTLFAKGGAISGKGGKIETSGGAIDFEKIKVSTIAADGSAGEWLIDPWNFLFNSSQLSTLASNLSGNNVTISTANSSASGNPHTFLGTGHIEFQSDFSYSGSGARTLTLISNDDIWINGNITSTSGALSLVFTAPNSQGVFLNGDVSTNGGSVTFNNSPNIHFQKTSGVQSFNTGGGSLNFGTANLRLLRHNGSLEINTGSGTLNLGSGSVVSEGLFYALTDANLVSWGGPHVNSGKTYGVTVTTGRTYAGRLYFWDSWDNERGELAVNENGTWRYYFTAHRTHGATTEMTNIVTNFGTQYQITGPTAIGRSGWNDIIVDFYFVAQHTGALTTWNNLNQDVNDESLELANFWEIYETTTSYSTGTRSLSLISSTGQISSSKSISDVHLTVNTSNTNSLLSGIVSGSGITLTKTGSGTLTLSSNNTYTGNTSINAGTLVLQNDAPNPSNKTFNGTGQLRIEPSSAAFSSAFSTSGWSLGTGLTSLTVGKTTNTANVTLASTTTINGPVTVYAGNIYLNADINTSSANASVLLEGRTSIASNATNRAINSGSGNITLVTDFLVHNNSNSVNITSTGHFSFYPYNASWSSNYGTAYNFGGTTTSGNLVGSVDALGLNINGVSNLTGLTLGKTDNSISIALQTPISINGPINLLGNSIIIGADIATTNTTTGNIQVTGSTFLGSGNIAVAGGRTLTVNVSSSNVYSGVISGTNSTFVKEGNGIQGLSGNNTYSGSTTISAGTLQIGSNDTTGSLGTGAIINNATLRFNRSDNLSFSQVISGTGSLTKLANNTLTLTGDNTYSGTTTISAGTLQIGDGGATGRLGSGAVTVAANSTLNFNLNTATSFSNGFNYSAAGATIANTSSTSGAMITLSGGVNAGTNANTILDGGTAGITVSGAATPAASGAGVWIKGDVTFTGSDLSGLVISCAGSGSTMRFKTTATPWWFGSTNATNAPNIVVDAGVTVSQNVNQAAGSLFYNNLSGSGTISLAGSAATHTILGESSVANLSATSSIALVVGQGGSTGSITSGNITANNGITLNSTTSYTFSGILAGTTLTKQNTNTVTLTGTNTYTGATTISGGTLQLGNNGTTGSIGSGNIVNNGTLTINRSDNVTLANTISGTGVVNKLNNTTATFTANNSYTGATNITGTLVLQNNTPTSSSTTYQGTGQLRIESSGTTFTSAFSTTGWTFGNTLSGLTIGKTSNTANVTIGSVTTIAGPISVHGGTIALDANLTSTLANAPILIKATDAINASGNQTFTTNNGDFILWADSDNSGQGRIHLLFNPIINTANGSTNSGLSGGGRIVLAGGLDNGANGGTANDGIPDGFARNTSGIGIYFNCQTCYSQMYSGGGDIIIRGASTNASSGVSGIGVFTDGRWLANAGKGSITIHGTSTHFYAVNLTDPGGNNVSTGNKYLELISDKASGTAISITGTSNANYGVVFNYENPKEVLATGGGSIVITGTAGSNTGVFLQNTDILATSGDITINGGSLGILVTNFGTRMGSRTGTRITSSSSNIKWITNSLNLWNLNSGFTNNITTTGNVTIEPSSNSFTNAITFPITNLSIANTVSGLTLGKTTNTANVTFGSSTTIAGPITAYGGTIAINENIASSNGSTISLYGNSLTFGSGKTVTSTGQLIVAPQSTSTTIGIGGASGTLSLPASYFSTNFSDGFSNIQIGSNDQTGNISVNAFTLRDNMTLLTSGSLTLGGKPVLGNNNLTLGDAISTINVGSPANYFQTTGTGKVIRNIATGTNRLFPIGNAAYNPITVANNTGAADVFSIKVRDQVLDGGVSGTAMAVPLVNVTWDIDKSNANASSGVDFTLQWESSQERSSISSFALNHHNGTAWEFATGTSGSTSGSTTKTMTHTGYTGTFSPFAIGGAATALPVDLLHFDATLQQNNALLSWSTASEINNQGFDIEKSTDGYTWETIGFVDGAGNSFATQHYSFVDSRFHRLAYYRLKQLDWDGNYTYSPIRLLKGHTFNSQAIVLYPNPSKGSVDVRIAFEGEVQYSVYDVAGKCILSDTAKQHFKINHLSAGVYYLHIEGINLNEHRILIIE